MVSHEKSVDIVMFVWYILTHPNDRLYRLHEEIDEVTAELDKLQRELKVVDKRIAGVRSDIKRLFFACLGGRVGCRVGTQI